MMKNNQNYGKRQLTLTASSSFTINRSTNQRRDRRAHLSLMSFWSGTVMIHVQLALSW